MKKILIEGFSTEEILKLPDNQIDQYIFVDEPLVIKAGTSEILGNFKKTDQKLIIELGQIEGGGEGILLNFWVLARKYAKLKNINKIEWIVHAINCKHPNLKLKEVLEKKGFIIKDIPGIGEAYYLLDNI